MKVISDTNLDFWFSFSGFRDHAKLVTKSFVTGDKISDRKIGVQYLT